jgi:peptidoglycan/LPS O-acetylase OafA/YrhL
MRSRSSIAEFALLRLSRLYPLHFATLILVAFLQFAYMYSHGQFFLYRNTPEAFVTNLVFGSNWFPWQTTTFNGPIWSVSVEIVVYFGFFFVMWTLGPTPFVGMASSFYADIC